MTNLISLTKKIMIILPIAAILIAIGIYLFYPREEPKQWVISQGVFKTLYSQEQLSAKALDHKLTFNDLLEVASASSIINAQALKVGNKILLSTGEEGHVITRIPPGVYNVAAVPINGVDITGLPKEIVIKDDQVILNVGIVKGKGEVKEKKSEKLKERPVFSGGDVEIRIFIFMDKNGNGIMEKDEPFLKWAGVEIELTKK